MTRGSARPGRRWGPLAWLGLLLLGAFVALATVGVALATSPTALVADPLVAPSWSHPFGTDHLGRDLFARTATGARTSLLVAVASVALSAIVAVPLGVLAAWRAGHALDHGVMRTLEVLQVVPPFVLVLLLLGLAGHGEVTFAGLEVPVVARLTVAVALGFVPFFARIARAAAVTELESGYVEALRLVGVGERELLAREVLPNVVPAVGVQCFLALAIAVFAEGGLSYLGLSVPPPQPTLGNLVAEAGAQLLDGAWWFALIPGLVLVAGIAGANLLGDVAVERLAAGRRPTRDPDGLGQAAPPAPAIAGVRP